MKSAFVVASKRSALTGYRKSHVHCCRGISGMYHIQEPQYYFGLDMCQRNMARIGSFLDEAHVCCLCKEHTSLAAQGHVLKPGPRSSVRTFQVHRG